MTPEDTCSSLLKHVNFADCKPGKCSWLIPKKSKTPHGLLVELPAPEFVAKILSLAPTLKRACKGLTGVSIDKPLHARLSQPKEKAIKIVSSDTKLHNNALVSVVPLDFKATNSQPFLPPPFPLDRAEALLPVVLSSPNSSLMDLDSTLESTPPIVCRKRRMTPRVAAPRSAPIQDKGILGDPPNLRNPTKFEKKETRPEKLTQVNPIFQPGSVGGRPPEPSLHAAQCKTKKNWTHKEPTRISPLTTNRTYADVVRPLMARTSPSLTSSPPNRLSSNI